MHLGNCSPAAQQASAAAPKRLQLPECTARAPASRPAPGCGPRVVLQRREECVFAATSRRRSPKAAGVPRMVGFTLQPATSPRAADGETGFLAGPPRGLPLRLPAPDCLGYLGLGYLSCCSARPPRRSGHSPSSRPGGRPYRPPSHEGDRRPLGPRDGRVVGEHAALGGRNPPGTSALVAPPDIRRNAHRDVAPEASGPGGPRSFGHRPCTPTRSWPETSGSRAGPPARQQLTRSHWEPPLSQHGPSVPARPPLPPRCRRAQDPAPGGRQARGCGPAAPAPRTPHDPGRVKTAEGRLFPEGAVERHTGRQVAAARLGADAGAQVQIQGLAGRKNGKRARGHVWLPASQPRSVWCATAIQGRLLASWPAGQAQPSRSPARPSCLTAAGPKPLGATIESARPRSPSNATLVPRPLADLKTLPLVAGRLGEATLGREASSRPRSLPRHGERAEGGLFPEGAVERHPGRQVAEPGLGSSGGGQLHVEGLTSHSDGTRVRGHVWVPGGHPRSVCCAAAFQGRLRAAWPARQAGSAHSGALWCEGTEEVASAAVPGRGGACGHRRELLKEKVELELGGQAAPAGPRRPTRQGERRSRAQPSRSPGRPSCPTASGPKPLADTFESSRPLSASKATLTPTPPAELRTPPLVAGRPGEAAPALDPAPAPGRGDTAERGGGGLCRRELWRDTPAHRWRRRGWAPVGGGQVQVEGLAGRTDGNRARSGVWVRASHPGSVWGCGCLPGPPSGRQTGQASGERPLRRALWWEGPEEVGPAAGSGAGGAGGHRRGRVKEKAEREAKSLQHPVFIEV
ncbi:collagen alpha-2(I) chain-like [Phocoena phocoena]|uniref:collagen alpha-2(I) chain-like n=1 Tax=Phocoena phocoena TaxID=9742 RepID=UPI00330797AC